MVARNPDWDPWSDEALADPAAIHAELRSRCPFPYAGILGGFRSITRYDDIVEAALDTEHFKNGLRPKFSTPMLPLECDPPEHMAYRKLLQRQSCGHFLLRDMSRQPADLATAYYFCQ